MNESHPQQPPLTDLTLGLRFRKLLATYEQSIETAPLAVQISDSGRSLTERLATRAEATKAQSLLAFVGAAAVSGVWAITSFAQSISVVSNGPRPATSPGVTVVPGALEAATPPPQPVGLGDVIVEGFAALGRIAPSWSAAAAVATTSVCVAFGAARQVRGRAVAREAARERTRVRDRSLSTPHPEDLALTVRPTTDYSPEMKAELDAAADAVIQRLHPGAASKAWTLIELQRLAPKAEALVESGRAEALARSAPTQTAHASSSAPTIRTTNGSIPEL